MTDAIIVRGANKHYGDFAALDGRRLRGAVRVADRAAGPQRIG